MYMHMYICRYINTQDVFYFDCLPQMSRKNIKKCFKQKLYGLCIDSYKLEIVYNFKKFAALEKSYI